MGIPLKAGRLLGPEDDREDAPAVVVVNEAFARFFFPDGEALGKRITLGGSDNPPREIVGVVGDVQMRDLEEDKRIATYAAFGKEPWTIVSVALRTRASTGIAPALRAAVAAVDPQLAVGDITTMSRLVDDSLGQRRLQVVLLGMFGAIALLLAVIGVYGVMAYSVAQRVQEIGIRIALGAQPGQVRRAVLGRGLLLASAGMLVGIGGAAALNRVLAGFVYGISSTDPATYVASAAILLIVAALAAWLPAHRAARVDPMVAMRAE
jgi:putative ABC transport system permease protein